MYQPNPKRLRDWLSVPKSNGYESLHITVLGPESKWVEVQIRTERMDDIAEHGLAAHWRYKGIKSGGQMDEWLANIRAALEAGDNMEVMDNFKMTLAPRRCLCSPRRATSSNSPQAPPFSTSPIASTRRSATPVWAGVSTESGAHAPGVALGR